MTPAVKIKGAEHGTTLHRTLARAPKAIWEMTKRKRRPNRTALEKELIGARVSKIARYEAWRKELHRPATHVQKWWAQRLGSVVRTVLCAATSPSSKLAFRMYGRASRLNGVVVYDPFAGAGTTLVEAAKMGATVIGRDLNPVAVLAQRQAFQPWTTNGLLTAFEVVRKACSADINALYRTEAGEEVLYFFWVAIAQCPVCNVAVDLFRHSIYAHHAYPKAFPLAQAVCLACKGLFTVDISRGKASTCPACAEKVCLPEPPSSSGRFMTCASGHQSEIVVALRRHPIRRRMYAKLVLTKEGKRQYRAIDDFDQALYRRASGLLRRNKRALVQPRGTLEPGGSTAQPLRWGFRTWASFFNSRQLYCLGRIGQAIHELPSSPEREALASLFMKTLEFNNVFASYKGAGTGAVRSVFHNHTLKPERTPLEANPWGRATASGSMAALFPRLLRAQRYKQKPSDLLAGRKGAIRSVEGLSLPISRAIVRRAPSQLGQSKTVYISCGDSSSTDLPDAAVDIVLTDPPYRGKVHYSELADFFHAWLAPLAPFTGYPTRKKTTRHRDEVQAHDVLAFGAGLERVWADNHRVLKPDGLLIFSFHESLVSSWQALMQSLKAAGFVVTALQPVMAEMATSVAKSGTHEPSNLDAIVVCRKRRQAQPWARTVRSAGQKARRALEALRAAGITFSSGDVKSVVHGSVMSVLTGVTHQDPGALARAAGSIATRIVKAFQPRKRLKRSVWAPRKGVARHSRRHGRKWID